MSLTGFLSSSFTVASSANRFRVNDDDDESPLLLATDDGGLGGDDAADDSSGIGVDSFDGPLDNLLPEVGVSGTKMENKLNYK